MFIIIYKYCTQTLVSRGQTAYFSFDMGAEKNKGLAYYRYMFCAHWWQICNFSITAMALLHLGPVIFGGNAKIITYLRSHGLLSSSKSCVLNC